MGILPHGDAFFSGKLGTLIECRMTLMAQRCDSEVVSLEPPPLPVSELIGMGGYDGTVVVFTAARAVRDFADDLE